MFGLILFIVVLSFIGRLFTRPYYGYRRSRIYPFGGFGGWGMGYPYHHHHHMGYGPMGRGRRW